METDANPASELLAITIVDDEVVLHGLGPAGITLSCDEALEVGVRLLRAALEIDRKLKSR